MSDAHELAEDLRAAIGELVRVVRTIDTLPPGEAALLGYLDRDGPLTVADVARRRRVRHQSVAKSAKDLTDAGLLTSGPHPDDQRMRLLHLTDAGRRRLNEERHQRADLLAEAIAGLADGDRAVLRSSVELITRLTDTLR